jgi:UDPglucose--hexose-1-phosphate uridylyltransferase
VIAPERAHRPGAGRGRIEEPTQEELDDCPFCGGREDRTPPETLHLGEPWRVRVVPNLYPAFERQEVVIHSREHKRSFAELDDDEVELVAEAWTLRRAAQPEGYLHAIVNEGHDAGASLAHSHSQLVWLPETPPAVVEETGPGEPSPSTEVASFQNVNAVCSPAGRVPYELLIGIASPGDAFGADLPAALVLLRNVVRRLRTVEGPVPWNAWLHVRASDWHIEVVPRLTVFAGLELGAGVFVNPLPPETAAERLRAATP